MCIRDRIYPFYRALFADGNPSGIKALLALMNKAQDVVRLPLTPVTQPTRDTLAAALAAISRG